MFTKKLHIQDLDSNASCEPSSRKLQFWSKGQIRAHLLAGDPGVASFHFHQLSSFILYRLLGSALEVLYLETRAPWRGQGIMKKLLKELIETHQNLEIWLEVHVGNHRARALYESLSFLQMGRRPSYYRDGGDALVLSRPRCGRLPVERC